MGRAQRLSGSLLEHPAVTFDVLDAALTAVRGLLRLTEDARPGSPCALDLGLDVVNRDPDAVHDPRHVVHPGRCLEALAQVERIYVVGAGMAEENQAVAGAQGDRKST